MDVHVSSITKHIVDFAIITSELHFAMDKKGLNNFGNPNECVSGGPFEVLTNWTRFARAIGFQLDSDLIRNIACSELDKGRFTFLCDS